MEGNSGGAWLGGDVLVDDSRGIAGIEGSVVVKYEVLEQATAGKSARSADEDIGYEN